MTLQEGFPRKILNQSSEDRLAYFEQHKIDHPMLTKVFYQLLDAIDKPDKGSLIFVYGPTGVGKTTLKEKIVEKLIERSLKQLKTDKGKVPVVTVEAVAPESGNFNWKDFHTRSLIELEEPLIDYKIDYGEKGIRRNSEGEIIIESRVSSPVLHRSLEKCLKYRRPDIFLIDEAHHFGIMSSGQKLKTQLECLKSLANMSSTNLGLLGTYDLLTFRNLGGQLNRRSIDIHFPRYKANNLQDLKAFVTVLKTFQKYLPLSEEPDLLSNWEYFYERSLGCIGILKDWLTRTLRDVLDKQIETIEMKHVQARALSVSQCKQILIEIEEGEKTLEETQKHRDELRSALGLTKISSPKKSKNATKRNSKVGQRKPTRDTIGQKENVQ